MTEKQDTRPSSAITRRAALASTAAVGVLALPAAAVAVDLPGAVDPHIAWWRERERFRALADDFAARLRRPAPLARLRALEKQREDLAWAPQWRLEHQIVETAPNTPEAAAIVATVTLDWCDEGSENDVEVIGGAQLARYILATTPADVLRRAGLEARS